MMGNTMALIGLSLHLLMSLCDHFIYEIPTVVYIPLAVIGIGLELAGIICACRKKK